VSEYSQITYDVSDHVATITLNRPERLNAVTALMIEEWLDALDRSDGDDEVRAVVVTGSGRAFCAGADLGDHGSIFNRGDDDEFVMEKHVDLGGVLARRMYDSYKPLIAAINGPAVGIGASILLPMDIRLASDTARIGFVFSRRGIVVESCSSWFLPRIVGISQAAEWVFSGRIFDADEALRTGLVRSVYPGADLLTRAYELAHELTAESAPVAVAMSRRMMWRMLGASSPEVAHEIDSRGIFYLGRGADVREGVDAFLEKRHANFPLRVSQDLPDFIESWPFD
jgi:enoyl-CoA hydratase/carnithine racemase